MFVLLQQAVAVAAAGSALMAGSLAPAFLYDGSFDPPKTSADLRQAVPSSVLGGLHDKLPTADSKATGAAFANMTKYYGGSSAADTRKARFKVPIQGAKKLAVGVGNTAFAVMGVQIITSLGVDAAGAMLGQDIKGNMCKAEGHEWTSILTGSPCENAGVDPLYVANADAVTGFVGGPPITVTTDAFHYWLGPGLQDVQIQVLGVQFITQPGYDDGANQACLKVTQGGRNVLAPASPEGMSDGVGLQFKWAGGGKDMGSLFYASSGAPGSYLATDTKCGPYPGTGGIAYGPGSNGDPLTGALTLESMTWNGRTSVMQQSSADPDRVLECTITSESGKTYTAKTAAFKESTGKWPAPSCPALPAGEIAARSKVVQTGGPVPKTLSDDVTTPEYRDWAKLYPECASGACLLDLRKISGGPEVSCFDSPDACKSWFTEPAKADNYLCRYGTHDVPLSECTIYANAFDAYKIAIGQGYADPLTGSTSPTTSPTTTPASKTVMDSMVKDSENPRDCFPEGWVGDNPVNLVLRPVQCALEWAFVPTATQLSSNVEKVKTAALTTAGVGIANIFALAPFPLPDAVAACEGPRVDFHWGGLGGVYHPLSACVEPLKSIAPLVRGFGAALLLGGTLFTIAHHWARIFNYIGMRRMDK